MGRFFMGDTMLLIVGTMRLLPENLVRDLIPVKKRWTDQTVPDA